MKKDDFLAKFEHDACGIGAIVSIDGKKTHSVVTDALTIVERRKRRFGDGRRWRRDTYPDTARLLCRKRRDRSTRARRLRRGNVFLPAMRKRKDNGEKILRNYFREGRGKDNRLA